MSLSIFCNFFLQITGFYPINTADNPLTEINICVFFFSRYSPCLLICSCSRIPEPAGFEYSSQSKMQAAHHWDVLALDVANQINKELIKDDLLNTAVYVKKTCGEDDAPCKPNETSQFDEGFHDLLVTQLVRYGVPTCYPTGT